MPEVVSLANEDVTAEPQNPWLLTPEKNGSKEKGQNQQTGSSLSQTLEELHTEKKRIKQQLKAFDAHFLATYGRAPSKVEKEQIRHVYQVYHTIKVQIKVLEAQLESTDETTESHRPIVRNETTDSSSRESEEKKGSEAHAQEPVIGSAGTTCSSGEAMVSVLEAEKQRLHDMLKDFERQFERRHGRPVSTPGDIAAVQSDYYRYKELKTLLSGGDAMKDTPKNRQ